MALESEVELAEIQKRLDRVCELLDELLVTMCPLTEWFRILSSEPEGEHKAAHYGGGE